MRFILLQRVRAHIQGPKGLQTTISLKIVPWKPGWGHMIKEPYAKIAITRGAAIVATLCGVLGGPVTSRCFIGLFVSFVLVGDLGHERILRIGFSQQGRDRQQNSRNGQSWAPLILQNIQTDCSVLVNLHKFWKFWENKKGQHFWNSGKKKVAFWKKFRLEDDSGRIEMSVVRVWLGEISRNTHIGVINFGLECDLSVTRKKEWR